MAKSHDTAVKALLNEPASVPLRPRYEGSNICTWIGFKHVNYLIEEAVLERFRACGLPARELYEAHGLGLDLVDIDTRILTALHMDDLVFAEVASATTDDSTELVFRVVLTVERDGVATKAVTSKARFALRAAGAAQAAPTPLARFVTARIGADGERRSEAVTPQLPEGLSSGRGSTGSDPVLDALTSSANAFGWKWRIPYFYCHFNERMQMSGYLRQMEEVVDLFLADRGISIRALLTDRDWIPVVPHSRIRMLDEALMEEQVYTVYSVEDVYKDVTYTSRMDCYVQRDGRLVHTATGTITHGYAAIEGRDTWSLVTFDERVGAALRGRG